MKTFLIVSLVAGVVLAGKPPKPVLADTPSYANDDDRPKDEKCREDENVLDCIIRMNQGNSKTDSYSTKIGDVQLFEGDIVYTERLKSEIGQLRAQAENGITGFDAIRNGAWRKDGKYAIIPYTFARGFSYTGVVRQAIEDYNRYTCIRFKEYTAELARKAGGYIEFMHGGGCYSMIGRQGGKQQVSLGRGCNYKGTAIHEMMHALGWFHEQSRRDRDQYIKINFNNINRRMWYNFEKYRSGQASTLGEPYDKKSVMHYGNYAFSINGQKTIVSLSNPNERFGGQFVGLSQIDKNQLNKYYQCNNGPQPTQPPTQNCVDQYIFCGELKSCCASNRWLQAKCKKTCNKCSTTPVKKCADKNRDCAHWARQRYCNSRQYATYMKDNCQKSCRYCK